MPYRFGLEQPTNPFGTSGFLLNTTVGLLDSNCRDGAVGTGVEYTLCRAGKEVAANAPFVSTWDSILGSLCSTLGAIHRFLKSNL
jgi:hypothetical protein